MEKIYFPTHSPVINNDIPRLLLHKRLSADDMGLESPHSRISVGKFSESDPEKEIRAIKNTAMQYGINLAQRDFIAKIITMVSAGAVLVVTGIITGFADINASPSLALACMGFTMSMGDVVSAYHTWHNKKQGKEGLALASDSVGNIIYWLSAHFGISDERAKLAATYASVITHGVHDISTVSVGNFISVAMPDILSHASCATSVGKKCTDIISKIINVSPARKKNESISQPEQQTPERLDKTSEPVHRFV
ncbi:TPA: hypothetical protein OKV73_004648 [Escherichia albertii]|uniref:hypothetical protein n=1 Tax=Escherichia albertii TaxID=208962 RepID=UPI000AA558AA|nr:hypothetical protein [Escherichia albertii]HCQ4576771.1 hypothetical protein [Escherichia albertii]